jgi:hypothetical protein
VKAADVAALLRKMRLRSIDTVHGFELRFEFNGLELRPPCRIESGGGIAGNNHKWIIVEVRGGKSRSGYCSTVAELRRALTELLAGPKPWPEGREGYVIYARRNVNRNGEHYIWIQRRAQEQK